MEQGGRKEILRLRIAEISLKRLWGRRRISPEFVEEVAEWLSGADAPSVPSGNKRGEKLASGHVEAHHR
jgi:hypothetical protein